MIELLLSAGGKRAVGDTTTYLGFLDYLDASPEIAATTWAAKPNSVAKGVYVKLQCLAAAGALWGSPYRTKIEASSSNSRVVQHAMPSLDIFNENVQSKRWVLMKFIAAVAPLTYPATTRNGYSSSSYTGSPGVTMPAFVYYDYTLDKVMSWNPNTASAPAPFVPDN